MLPQHGQPWSVSSVTNWNIFCVLSGIIFLVPMRLGSGLGSGWRLAGHGKAKTALHIVCFFLLREQALKRYNHLVVMDRREVCSWYEEWFEKEVAWRERAINPGKWCFIHSFLQSENAKIGQTAVNEERTKRTKITRDGAAGNRTQVEAELLREKPQHFMMTTTLQHLGLRWSADFDFMTANQIWPNAVSELRLMIIRLRLYSEYA